MKCVRDYHLEEACQTKKNYENQVPVQQLRGDIIKGNKLTKKTYGQIGITSFVKSPLKTRYHKRAILYMSNKTSPSL